MDSGNNTKGWSHSESHLWAILTWKSYTSIETILDKARGMKTDANKADLAKASYEAREKALALQAAPDITMTEAKEPMQLAVLLLCPSV